MAQTPARIGACIAALLLSGCGSSMQPTLPTPSPTASQAAPTSPSTAPSPTPTPTWSAEQAGAIAAVDEYRAVIGRIEADPAAFSEKQMRTALAEVAGGDVIDANVNSYLDLQKKGLRFDGTTTVVSTLAGDVSQADYGVEVVVTRCIDQRDLRALDSSGTEVGEAELGYEIPDFNLRQYTVVKTAEAARFLVYGLSPTKGECGP